MDSQAFDEVFGTLSRERDEVASKVGELRAALDEAESRLKDVDGVLAGLQRLQLISAPVVEMTTEVGDSNDDEAVESDSDAHEDHVVMASNPDQHLGASRQRIRSTEMVADLVNRAARPMTRDQIIERFSQEIGIPESWSNPRNAIGNALSRASGRGWIAALDGDRFGPAGWVEVAAHELNEESA